MEFTPDQRAYLDRNLQGVLATSRRDGSPQLSTIHFSRLDDGIYVGASRSSAKWHNARCEPRVALLVGEGSRQLVVYGRAERVEADPERFERYREHRSNTAAKGSELGAPSDPAAFRALIEEGNRALLRITPERVLGE